MNDEEQMPCHIEMSSSFEEEEREEPSSLLHADNETKNEDEMEENNDTKEFYMSDNISNDITPVDEKKMNLFEKTDEDELKKAEEEEERKLEEEKLKLEEEKRRKDEEKKMEEKRFKEEEEKRRLKEEEEDNERKRKEEEEEENRRLKEEEEKRRLKEEEENERKRKEDEENERKREEEELKKRILAEEEKKKKEEIHQKTLAAVKKIDKAIDQLIDVENEYNDDTMNGDKSTKYSLHANKTLKATEKLTDALKEYVVQPSFTNTNSSTTTTTTTTTSTTTEEEQTLDENETKNDDVFVKFEILLPDGASEETSNKIDILRHRDWITAVRDYANKVQNTEDNDEIDDEICSGELIIIQKNENKQIQVREDSGTTFINGIEGDILIKEIPGNVNMNGDTFEEDNVKHVENEQNQSHVAMNILGQAYAQNFNGNLQLKPYFKGLIVIKTVSSIKYYQKDL